MKEDGGKALPQVQQQCLQGGQSEYIGGMSLRDYFAGQALTGLLAADTQERHDEEWMAVSAYSISDAMLAERAQP